MRASPPRPRFALRSRTCRMAVPDHKRLIERPESPRKLKLRGRPTVWGFVADESHRCLGVAGSIVSISPRRSFRNVPHREVHKKPRQWACRACFSRRPRAGCGQRSQISLRLGCCSRLHGWIPMAVDGTSAPGAKNFPLPVSPASGDPDRHSSRMRLRRQNSWLQPGRSAALALRSPLACSGSVSSSRP